MTDSRLTPEIRKKLEDFITTTVTTWQQAGLVKNNSYAVIIQEAPTTLDGFGTPDEFRTHQYGESRAGAEHDVYWYLDNVRGKAAICIATQMDSHEAVRLYQGALIGRGGIFSWGGAIYDGAYGLIVSVSGFNEDEDIFFARTVRNYVVMLLDRAGQAMLDDARLRGTQKGDAGADRFTRP